MACTQQSLALYQSPSCFYCQRVRAAIDELGVVVELRDIRQQRDYYEELIQATGRQTVPVLRIEATDGSVAWMPESADIIRYLQSIA